LSLILSLYFILIKCINTVTMSILLIIISLTGPGPGDIVRILSEHIKALAGRLNDDGIS